MFSISMVRYREPYSVSTFPSGRAWMSRHPFSTELEIKTLFGGTKTGMAMIWDNDGPPRE